LKRSNNTRTTTVPTTYSRAVPIYRLRRIFKDAEHAANLFGLKEFGNIYTRIMNPTSDVFEQRIAALEGGIAALAVASGHAAQFITFTNIMGIGDNFVSSPFLYGGTYNQFTVTFKQLGIEARLANDLSVESFEKLIDEKTKAIYLETIGNPGFVIPDFDAFAALARKYDILFIVEIRLAQEATFSARLNMVAISWSIGNKRSRSRYQHRAA
jgi:O-acetylhomoserine (thiol)-lyase